MSEYKDCDNRGRYWRFDPCGLCDDQQCAEGDAVDVTAEVESALREVESLNYADLRVVDRTDLLGMLRDEADSWRIQAERSAFSDDPDVAVRRRLEIAVAMDGMVERVSSFTKHAPSADGFLEKSRDGIGA